MEKKCFGYGEGRTLAIVVGEAVGNGGTSIHPQDLY
jgi:hypothetical protein